MNFIFLSYPSFLVLLILVASTTTNTATQTIKWTTCPPGQPTSSYKIDCANLTFPLNYNNPSMGNVTAFIRRQYVNKPTKSGLWAVAGGPGDSTILLAGPLCDYFIGSNTSFTCYTQDARGTGLSSYMSCGKNQPVGPFNPYNSTTVTAFSNCINKIKSNYGSVLQYYSTYNAMKDLLGAIQLINPSLVLFYVQSYGTYAMNTYMLLPGARADVIVFDGPIPPNRWPFENNAGNIIAYGYIYAQLRLVILLMYVSILQQQSGVLKSLKTWHMGASKTHLSATLACQKWRTFRSW